MEYLIAQSVADILASNVIYRECSSLVVETITLGRYDQDQGGEERLIEEHIYNKVVRRVIEKEFEPIAKDAIYETALFASKPSITFGLNLRDPLELLLFQKINQVMEDSFSQISEEALLEEVENRRELQIVDSLIARMPVLGSMLEEVLDECLLEGVEEYVVEGIFSRVVGEGVEVVAQTGYSSQVAVLEDEFVDELSEQA